MAHNSLLTTHCSSLKGSLLKVTGNGYAFEYGGEKSGEMDVRIWGKVGNEGEMAVSLQC